MTNLDAPVQMPYSPWYPSGYLSRSSRISAMALIHVSEHTLPGKRHNLHSSEVVLLGVQRRSAKVSASSQSQWGKYPQERASFHCVKKVTIFIIALWCWYREELVILLHPLSTELVTRSGHATDVVFTIETTTSASIEMFYYTVTYTHYDPKRLLGQSTQAHR